jgi:hypothetical protein
MRSVSYQRKVCDYFLTLERTKFGHKARNQERLYWRVPVAIYCYPMLVLPINFFLFKVSCVACNWIYVFASASSGTFSPKCQGTSSMGQDLSANTWQVNLSWPRISTPFMDSNGSLPYSLEPATRSYLKSVESYQHSAFYFFNIYFNIFLLSVGKSFTWSSPFRSSG